MLVDEASLAGTARLDWLTQHANTSGAVVRLLGDPYQLSAVETGGAFRLLVDDIGGPELDTLHRFHDPDEAAATLKIRHGDSNGLHYYEDNGRITTGSGPHLLELAYKAWDHDTTGGLASVIITSTEADARALNTTARTARIHTGAVDGTDQVHLHDGTHASEGDIVITRRNDRAIRTTRGGFVRNGDHWTVTTTTVGGTLTVTRSGETVELPAGYVSDHVQLGYAVTAHRAQGITVDTAHVLVDDTATRESLYVAMTRARARTHIYVPTNHELSIDAERPPAVRDDPRVIIAHAISRSIAEQSATQVHRRQRFGSPTSSRPTDRRRGLYQHPTIRWTPQSASP